MHLYFLLPVFASTAALAFPSRRDSNNPSSQDTSSVSSALQSYGLPQNQLGASVFSMIYGVAFSAFAQEAASSGILTNVGTNKLHSNEALASPGLHLVVRPNADTVYSSGVYDLSSTDVVLEVPPFESDRFYLFAFYDPYGDQFAALGTPYNNQSGKYLLRSTSSQSSECDAAYVSCITAPTLDGIVLNRVEAKNNDTDLVYVDTYLNATTLTPVDSHAPIAAPLTISDFADIPSDTVSAIFTLTARLASRNPPEVHSLAEVVPEILSWAGIDTASGSYTPQPNVNLTEVYALFNATILAFSEANSTNYPLTSGWTVLNPSWQGTFNLGQDLVARAYVALVGYLANKSDEALYPSPPNVENLALTSVESYLMTFYSKPPVEVDGGFWSVTMYGADQYLVENAIGVYALGDRSNLTYPDGSLVYGETNTTSGSGQFQILIQDADIAPPTNWTSNWLPAPAGGGTFTISMRLYDPTGAALDGSYTYPELVKQAALT